MNNTKPKQVKRFDNEDEQRATDSVCVFLANCAPSWAPTLNAVLPPPLRRPTPTVKDQTGCLAPPSSHTSQSQARLLWMYSGREPTDQTSGFLFSPHLHSVWQTPPSPARMQTEAPDSRPGKEKKKTTLHHYCTPKRLQWEI